MPQFVILEHDHPQLHWDFMLEAGETLRTWRLEAEPQPDTDIPATPLPDHRRHYLDYEGLVSGNRGSVQQWDHGTFEWIENSSDRVEADLVGRKLSGRAVLTPIDGGEDWTFHLTQQPL